MSLDPPLDPNRAAVGQGDAVCILARERAGPMKPEDVRSFVMGIFEEGTREDTMNIDKDSWKTHPGPSVPEWWKPIKPVSKWTYCGRMVERGICGHRIVELSGPSWGCPVHGITEHVKL